MLAALASAAGVYFTGRSLEATRTQTAIAEQGQLTDRFTKAVDQLDRTGTDHLQARLGAIYALERLARDSPRDQPTVVEVLSAFIRTTTPRPTPADAPPSAATCPAQALAPDIQAAFTVLGRRDTTHDRTARTDLHNTCLTHANLHRVNLHRANLQRAVLNADLSGADLRGADLTDADLTGAVLTNADLTDTDLFAADLTGAYLGDANLGNGHLRGAHLSGVDLTGANLGGADLTGVDLTGANLTEADLSGADLTGANLTGANLTEAHHDENTIVIDVVTDKDTKSAWW